MQKKKSRDAQFMALTEAIRQLTDRVSSASDYTREAGPGLDGVRRRAREEGTYRVAAPGLLAQLVGSLRPGASTGDALRSKPGPRTPSAAAISDTLHAISKEAGKLRADMRAEAGDKATASGKRRTVSADLLEIRALAHAVGDDRLADAVFQARRWVTRARVALTWDAPVVTLSEARCPYCGGELQVRSDASSDVWCAGSPATKGLERQPPCRDDSGEPRTWPQSSWLLLLERLSA